MPPPTGIKLRDSCHACAASKVRCSKDKPTCARCTERDTTCEYLVTQRTGRKFRYRTNTDPLPTLHNATANHNGGSRPLSAESGMAVSINSEPCNSMSTASGEDGGFLDSFNFDSLHFRQQSLDVLDFSTSLQPPSNCLADASTVGSASDIFGQQASLTGDSSADGFGAISSSISLESGGTSPDSLDLALPDLTRSFSFPVDFSTQSNLGDPACRGATEPHLKSIKESNTGGLEAALLLMSQLSCQEANMPTSTGRNFSDNFTNDGENCKGRLLQAVIERNKEVVSTIEHMLSLASPPQDGCVLVIISMVVSRVLSGYAAAARGPSPVSDGSESPPMTSSSHSSTSMRSSASSPWPADCPTTRDSGVSTKKKRDLDPKTAQKVLNELYQVEKLIDQIGSRMQSCTRASMSAFGQNSDLVPSDMAAAGFPFSAEVLNQLDTDLRKRLSTLSLELIDGIRQYWG